MKTLRQEIWEAIIDLKEYSLILVTIAVCIAAITACSVQIGCSIAQRDAIKSGHAFWASDQYGNPEFRWKEQQQVIGEYLGLNKK